MNEVPSTPRAGRWEGIRLYLIGLALLGAVPLVALNLYRVASRSAEGREDMGKEAIRVARAIASQLDERVRTADALLLGVSADLQPTRSKSAHNDSVLTRTLAAIPGRYANIYVVDAEGTLVGTAKRNSAANEFPQAFAGRGYFKVAKAKGGFVVGETRRSVVLPDSAWVVILARTLTDSKSQFIGVVATSVRLDSLTNLTEANELADPPKISIFDTAGVVLARPTFDSSYVGQKMFPVGVPVDTEDVAVIKWLDGVPRLTGFTHTNAAPWLVNVGVSQVAAGAQLRRMLLEDLALLLVAVGLTVLVGYRVGQRITRPIESLADEARALARGAVSTRTRLSGPREVQLLGDAFNQMADTVERRNASLADSERRYRMLFDSNPLPMWAWDVETMTVTAVNEAAVEKYGYTREAFLSLRILDLIAPEEHDRFSRAGLPFAESRQSAGSWMHRTASGERMEMDVVTTFSRRLGRASWLSVGIDVTARHEAERALAISEEQLRQSQKMEAIGAFAGGISHDFNNLLTGMLGYCDLALGELEERSPLYNDVSEIRALAMRGAELTKQILAVSRKQVVQPTVLDPNEVVRGLDRLLRRLIGEHIDLETTLGSDVGTIRADAGQLEQVLLSLSANARDAMPNGGRLSIETARVSEDVAVANGLNVTTSWMLIAVTDSGHGMSEDVRLRVFEPFFTTKERGKGTGLGLALAYATLDQGGGAIRVESQLGVGTTFLLFFPAVVEAHAMRVVQPPSDVLRDGTETILLAEDEDSVRAVAAAALERHGYRVLSAPDGEAALLIARQYGQTIDLLLTDAVMPRMNGRELAEKVALIRPAIRVLFASGYTDDALLLHGIRTDELSFLQKPFAAVDLLRRVRSVLDQPNRAQ